MKRFLLGVFAALLLFQLQQRRWVWIVKLLGISCRPVWMF